MTETYLLDADTMLSGKERDPAPLDLAAIEAVEPDEPEEQSQTPVNVEAITVYLRDVQKNKLLTADEEMEVAAKVERGDHGARAVMIVSNLRLVVRMARRYLNRGLPFLDLIEEGNVGLIKAVDRFRLSKGCRFSTYATWWIRQGIERALVNQSRVVRLPVHVSEHNGRMVRATLRLRQQLSREPTLQEVADELGEEVAPIRNLTLQVRGTFSIDQPMGDSEDYLLSDIIEDITATSPADLCDNLTRYRLVATCLETLSGTEKEVLTLRFGLSDNEPQTLEAIGRRFGVTRERIRQIERDALEKLRGLIGEDGAEMQGDYSGGGNS